MAAKRKKELSFEEGMEKSFFTPYSFVYVQCFTELWRAIYDHITAEENNIIRADDKTLTDADSEAVTTKVLSALSEKIGASLR